ACVGEPEQHADHRRLARAVRTQEPERAATGYMQVDRVHGGAPAEPLGETAGLDRRVLGEGWGWVIRSYWHAPHGDRGSRAPQLGMVPRGPRDAGSAPAADQGPSRLTSRRWTAERPSPWRVEGLTLRGTAETSAPTVLTVTPSRSAVPVFMYPRAMRPQTSRYPGG